MTTVTYSKDMTGLVVIDPYNDFISAGGKVWDRLTAVIEATDCVAHMEQVLVAARSADIRVFMRCIADTGLATTKPGST